tara:strand:- start:110 stop:292 length:183 start_codon:yes stop_codon:yes gene_type:complete
MSEVENILLDFELLIKKELHTLIDKDYEGSQQIVHNHPPVTFIVKDCPYCLKYGNCFYKN